MFYLGVSRIEHGLEKDNSLEVNAGMALVEEARSKIRVIRSKLIHREYIRELDNNNRLLAIGKLTISTGSELHTRFGFDHQVQHFKAKLNECYCYIANIASL